MSAAADVIALKPAESQGSKATEIQGRIDAVEGNRIYGWAWDRKAPESRLEIQLWLGERHLGTVTADKERTDLRANGIGDGRHAFELALDEAAAAAVKEARGEETRGEITALARSPATGALVALARPTAAETAAERVVAPPLRRIAEGLETLRAGQRRIYEAQQAAAQGIKELVVRSHDWEAEKLTALDQGIAELRAGQEALARAFAEIEVYQLRFDAALRDLDAKLAARPDSADRPLRTAVGVLAVLTLVALGLGVVALGHGIGG